MRTEVKVVTPSQYETFVEQQKKQVLADQAAAIHKTEEGAP
jgi:hypothetical protein